MSATLKAAFLLGSLNRGGTETLVLDVLKNASEAPFSMLCIYRKEGELSKAFRATGVKMINVIPGRAWLVLFYLRRLRRIFRKEGIQIVHAQQRLDAVYARLAGLGLPVKVIQTFHGYEFPSNKFMDFLVWLSIRIVHLNQFVSETQQEYYQDIRKLRRSKKQVVTYNGIDFNKLNTSKRRLLRSEFGLREENLLLGMVGNFVPVRDPLTVCRFLKLLPELGIDFTFLFIGKRDENYPHIYEACVSFCRDNGLSDKVLFLGSRSDVPAILPQLDAFVYSTNHDTFGIAVIEAIASGIPVFVNDWKVMQEITKDGQFAILYKTKDEKDLLNKFLNFIADKERISELAKQHASQIREIYSIQNHLRRLDEVYRNLITT